MTKDFLSALSGPFISATERLASYTPNLAAAFLLLLAGMFTARALRTVVEQLLSRARLDDYTSRVGINEVMARLGLGSSPSYGISFLVHWFVLFAFIVSAANAVDMMVVSDLLERFLLFLPRLLASVLILFAGLLFARFLAEVVTNASTVNSIPGAAMLSRGVYACALIFGTITALEQLGLQMALVTSAVLIVLASAGLAFALAFGLGGREVAGEILRDVLKRK